MSEIKVNSIKGVGATAAAITVNNTDGTCTANITNNLSNRRLTINGDMIISQRGTSSTTLGYVTVDRFLTGGTGMDENPTFEQADVDSSVTPYTLGFRKTAKLTNGNQTSGAGAGDVLKLNTKLEAQDLATSGWNYTSASSFITLSFWVRSSVAQTFFARLQTIDGTPQNFPFSYAVSANTWTKVTKTISGNSNIQIDNNNGIGLDIEWILFRGTNTTDSGVTLDAWQAYSAGTRAPDQTSTWYTTNDATWEITGVQLEVGSVATDFEHRSFGQELALCQRYCVRFSSDGGSSNGHYGRFPVGYFAGSTSGTFGLHHPPMRAVAGRTITNGITNFEAFFNGGGGTINPTITLMGDGMWTSFTMFNISGFPSGRTDGAMMTARVSNRPAWFIIIDNEL